MYSNKQNLIFTPNPEMLVDAQSDRYFKKVLNLSDLNISDGFGVTFVSGGKIKRITGVDFVLKLCELAQKENKSIYLLGSGSKEVLKKTAENLKKQFPNLRIAGFDSGPKIDFLMVEDENKIIFEPEANDNAVHDIIMTAPDILFVAFGHNKQEKWIYENLKNLPTVKIAMGVGGSFDYIAGFNYLGETTLRAPCFLRKIGLEWLYRLFRQPWRLSRIFKATAVFISFVVYKKIKKV
ncbi:MAG: WecB/TagA/CpsF family glycosyltransferase [Candidatus Magasanikbacteria bacterium]|nr:WecB/TagA/CpsF family glycosyltransferase [Candidatus Magasanikbacteria bacterium]